MLCYLDSGLDRRLIARVVRPGRQHGHAKMLGQVAVAGVQLRVIPAGFGDARLQIIRDDGTHRAAIEVQRIDVGAEPTGEILTAGRLHVQVATRAQCAGED